MKGALLFTHFYLNSDSRQTFLELFFSYLTWLRNFQKKTPMPKNTLIFSPPLLNPFHTRDVFLNDSALVLFCFHGIGVKNRASASGDSPGDRSISGTQHPTFDAGHVPSRSATACVVPMTTKRLDKPLISSSKRARFFFFSFQQRIFCLIYFGAICNTLTKPFPPQKKPCDANLTTNYQC